MRTPLDQAQAWEVDAVVERPTMTVPSCETLKARLSVSPGNLPRPLSAPFFQTTASPPTLWKACPTIESPSDEIPWAADYSYVARNSRGDAEVAASPRQNAERLFHAAFPAKRFSSESVG